LTIRDIARIEHAPNLNATSKQVVVVVVDDVSVEAKVDLRRTRPQMGP